CWCQQLWSFFFFFFSSRRRHTRCLSDWSSDVCSSDLFVFLNATLPLITASECANESLTTFVNAAVIVSVRTYVPLIIETPRTIAIAVRTVRSLRPKSPLSATLFIAPALP